MLRGPRGAESNMLIGYFSKGDERERQKVHPGIGSDLPSACLARKAMFPYQPGYLSLRIRGSWKGFPALLPNKEILTCEFHDLLLASPFVMLPTSFT